MIRILSKSRAGQDFLINLLPHKRAMLYFTQPSTRTFLSFMAACQILGITCNEVRDPSDVVARPRAKRGSIRSACSAATST